MRPVIILLAVFMLVNCNEIKKVNESTEETIEDCWRKVSGGCFYKLDANHDVSYSDSGCPGYRIVNGRSVIMSES